ncbi:VOC family protein [Dehalobacter sp.]|uniref:VOC family protein n=1 Tax=Dehalobacter sp. TaxID=1962289 RepID=UPI00258DCAD2|nr:VOC family protein [Dehalobacter sp.]
MGFCLTTVNVNNLEESLKFYQEVVGLPLVQRLHPDPSTEICFSRFSLSLIPMV